MHMVKKTLKTLKGIRNIFWGDSQSRVQGPKKSYRPSLEVLAFSNLPSLYAKAYTLVPCF